MSPTAQLAVEISSQRVIVHITIANPSEDTALHVEKYKVVAASPVSVKLFQLMCDGKEITYTGAMAKRRPLTREDFFRVAPGGEIKGFVDITDLYAFLPGVHQYTIEYRAFHADPDDMEKLVEIKSKPTSFHFER